MFKNKMIWCLVMYVIKKEMTNENKNSLKYGLNESDAESYSAKNLRL